MRKRKGRRKRRACGLGGNGQMSFTDMRNQNKEGSFITEEKKKKKRE